MPKEKVAVRYKSWLALIIVVVFVSCKSDTPTQPPVGAGSISAPKYISVRTIDTNTIGVAWSRAAGDASADTVIVTTQSGTLAAKVAVASPDSSSHIGGLHPGVAYWILVRSADSAATRIPWSIQSSPTNIPPPTNIVVRTIDTSTIFVSWSRGLRDNQADSVIVTTQGGALAGAVRVPAPDSVAAVRWLHPGIVYSILVRSADAAAPPISWTTGPAPAAILPPTGITVVSLDTTAIGLTWTRAVGDTKNDRVFVTSPGGIEAGNAFVPWPSTSTQIIGLHPGIAYSIVVSSADSASAPIPWTIKIPQSSDKVATKLMANSSSDGGINLRWTRDPGDNGVDTVFVWYGAYEIVQQIAVPAPGCSVTIGKLGGLVYGMSIHSSNGTSKTMFWSPARRMGTEANPIRVYEVTAQMNNGSQTGHNAGLCVSSGGTVLLNGDNLLNLHLILDDVETDPIVSSSSGLALVSPDRVTASSNHTYLSSPIYYSVGGLDSFYNSTDLSFTRKWVSDRDFEIPGDASPSRGSAILVMQVFDVLQRGIYYYAKVEVVQQPDGKLYGGTAPNRYVDLVISFNPTGSTPYASDTQPLPGPCRDYASETGVGD